MNRVTLGVFFAAGVAVIGCGRSTPVPTIDFSGPNRGVPSSRPPARHEVVSSAGGFKITFPGPPSEKKSTGREGKPIENYYFQTPDKALLAGFSYPAIPIPAEQLNELTIAGGLEGAAANFVKEVKGEFTHKKPIRHEAVQGLEFQAKVTGATPRDSGEVKGRVYWLDGKLIRLVAIGQPDWLQTKEVDDYFQSFALSAPK